MSVPPGAATPDPATPPSASSGHPVSSGSVASAGDDGRLLADAGAISLRLMAGAVSRRTFDQLRPVVHQGGDVQGVIQAAILGEAVDSKQMLAKAAAAQREWILRGGRTRGPSLGFRAKSLLARLCAQLIISALYAVLVLTALLLLKHHDASWDLYRVLPWFQGLLGNR